MASTSVKSKSSWRSQESHRSGAGDRENSEGLMHLSPRAAAQRSSRTSRSNTKTSASSNHVNRLMVDSAASEVSEAISEIDQILSPTISTDNSFKLMNSLSSEPTGSRKARSPALNMTAKDSSTAAYPKDNSTTAYPSLSSTYSADSIIRRVEEEIAAARTAALSALSAQQQAESNSSGDTGDNHHNADDDDAEVQIQRALSPRSTSSSQDGGASASSQQQPTSVAANSSFENALGIIDEEFDDAGRSPPRIFAKPCNVAPTNQVTYEQQQPPTKNGGVSDFFTNTATSATATTSTAALASTSWEEIDTIAGPGLQVDQVRNAWSRGNPFQGSNARDRENPKNSAADAVDRDLDDRVANSRRCKKQQAGSRRADGFDRVPDFTLSTSTASTGKAATVIDQESTRDHKRELDHLQYPRSEGGEPQAASEFLDFLKNRREELTNFLKQPTSPTHDGEDDDKDAVEKTRSGTPTADLELTASASASDESRPMAQSPPTVEKEHKEEDSMLVHRAVADPVFSTSKTPQSSTDGEEHEEDEQHFFDAAMTSTSSSGVSASGAAAGVDRIEATRKAASKDTEVEENVATKKASTSKRDSWLPSSWGISSSPRSPSARPVVATTGPTSPVRNADRFFFKEKDSDAAKSPTEAMVDRSNSPSSNVTTDTKSTVAAGARKENIKLAHLKEVASSHQDDDDSTSSPPGPPKLQREKNEEKEFKPTSRSGTVRCKIEVVSSKASTSMSPSSNNESSSPPTAKSTSPSGSAIKDQFNSISSSSLKLSQSASNGTTGVAVSATAAMQAVSPIIHSPPRPAAGREKSGDSSSPDRRQSSSQSPNKRMSNRIRFRDPYPVLKPASAPRKTVDIVADHALGPQDVPIRWIRPKADLKQLIVAAMGSSLQRRSNACGALKVLTKSKKNQMTLVRTDSFLTSLIFAAGQNIPAFRDREMALDARTRAIACIRAVCEPKDNRIHVLTYPGMIEVLIKVIEEDVGEARLLACGACAMLAKGVECRETMANDERLVDLLSEVLGGSSSRPRVALSTAEEKKEEHPDMGMINHEDDSSSSDGSHTDQDDEYPDDDDFSDQGSLSTHSSDEDSSDPENGLPLKRRGSDTETPPVDSIRKQSREKNSEFKQRSRASACAVLLHLSKHCAVSPTLCANTTLMNNVILVSNEIDNPIHTKCLEIILNLSRFPSNNARLTPYRGIVETMLSAGSSKVAEDRVAALRTMQNLSSDTSSKPLLATDAVLTFLTSCAMRKSPEEKEAAVSTLYNITTEPGAVVAITNTKNAVATLVHLAHNPNSSSTVRMMACEALATISLWLQTLAGTGKVPADVENVALPSQKTTGWERWD